MNQIRIGVSACLAGERVRYDAADKRDRYITDILQRYVRLVPVCPEVEMGLPVPREAMRLTGSPSGVPHLVAVESGRDFTKQMLMWARERTTRLAEEKLCGFIFKSRSPSSGLKGVKIYDEHGVARKSGIGLFADQFTQSFPFVPVIDDEMLQNAQTREVFIEKCFVMKRWHQLVENGNTIRNLREFHEHQKYQIHAHSIAHAGLLGRFIADIKPGERVKTNYISLMMKALDIPSTIGKNINVLSHIMGYFKKRLTALEKRELLDVFEIYREERIPLIAPIVILNHYRNKYADSYLEQQTFLNPDPAEVMLRYHV